MVGRLDHLRMDAVEALQRTVGDSAHLGGEREKDQQIRATAVPRRRSMPPLEAAVIALSIIAMTR